MLSSFEALRGFSRRKVWPSVAICQLCARVVLGCLCIQLAEVQAAVVPAATAILTCSQQEQQYDKSSVTWTGSSLGQQQEQVSTSTEPADLWSAMRRIVPRRLKLEVYTPQQASLDKVLWCSGRTWSESLDMLLTSVGMQASIDDELVRVSPVMTLVDTAQDPVSSKLANETSPAPAIQPSIVELQQWNIYLTDKTVRNTLNRWVRLAGWQSVSWELPVDIQIGHEANIRGSFEEALAVMADSLFQSDSPIEFVVYESNRVIRVIKLQKGGMK